MKVDTFFLALLEIINNQTKIIDRVDFYLDDKIILHTDDDLQITQTYQDLFTAYKEVLLRKITLHTFYKKKIGEIVVPAAPVAKVSNEEIVVLD